MRAERRRHGRLRDLLVVSLGTSLVALAGPAADAQTSTGPVTIEAANGSGRSVTPGRSCDDGGTGAYWHYEYGDDLAATSILGADVPVEGLVHLDLHSDEQRFPNVTGDPYPDGADPTAFLAGTESHASLLTDRGSIKLRLSSGDCDVPTLAFDGTTASGSGTWEVDTDSVSGAYRSVTGSGTFSMPSAEVAPGSDNALRLVLDGSLSIAEPQLQLQVLGTYWGQLGTDYLSRRVTVVYRVTNTGPGDSYGGRVTGVTDLTTGATPLVTTPFDLGDLRSGESREFRFRHQFSLLTGPCRLVILGCTFQTRFNVDLPNAFDQPHAFTATVTAKAPTLPPPL
jgi:hypothetical protein